MRQTIAAAVIGWLTVLATARADTITLGADEWCPINCEAGSDRPGYAVEVARAALAPFGHTIDYVTMPWPRALADSRTGAVTAVIGATLDEGRDFVLPTESAGVSDNTFLVRRGHPWRYTGLPSLDGQRIGAILGYAYGGEVSDYLSEKARLGSASTVALASGDNPLEINLRKLLAGRIDVTLDSKAVLMFTIAEMQIADRVEFAGSADQEPFYVAFSPALPQSRAYAAAYDQGVARLRATGELKAILARYGVGDLP